MFVSSSVCVCSVCSSIMSLPSLFAHVCACWYSTLPLPTSVFMHVDEDMQIRSVVFRPLSSVCLSSTCLHTYCVLSAVAYYDVRVFILCYDICFRWLQQLTN